MVFFNPIFIIEFGNVFKRIKIDIQSNCKYLIFTHISSPQQAFEIKLSAVDGRTYDLFSVQFDKNPDITGKQLLV